MFGKLYWQIVWQIYFSVITEDTLNLFVPKESPNYFYGQTQHPGHINANELISCSLKDQRTFLKFQFAYRRKVKFEILNYTLKKDLMKNFFNFLSHRKDSSHNS